MERTITVRSSAIDSWIRRFRAIEREKEKKLGIAKPLAASILITPALESSKLGFFRPDALLIVINEDLVENGTDREIENVFLHELAHALDYRLNGAAEHGNSFRACCRMLGIDEGFDKSVIKLSVSRMNARREKIRKIMALSSSPFENESASAIRKARKLMAESGLDGCAHEKIYMTALHSAGKFSYGTKMLLSYVEKASGVFIVTTHEGKERKAIAYGSLEEVEFSLYLFDYLSSSADREIRTRRKQGEHISKDNFMMGMIETLSSSTSESALDTSIIAIHDKNRDKAKRMIYPNTRLVTRSSRSSASFDDGSYGIGKCFGDNLDVPKAITRKAIR